MDRLEFIIVTAIILFIAFLLGWLGSWVFHKLGRVTKSDIAELEQMASALHAAEDPRDEARSYMQQREGELISKLGQTEAELQAAMDGLRAARQEAADLRAYIEAHSQT